MELGHHFVLLAELANHFGNELVQRLVALARIRVWHFDFARHIALKLDSVTEHARSRFSVENPIYALREL